MRVYLDELLRNFLGVLRLDQALFILENDILYKSYSCRLCNQIVPFNHKAEYFWQYLVKGWLFHLLTANSKDLAPFRVLSVFDPHIVKFVLGDLVPGMFSAATAVNSFVNGVVFNPIDCLNCLVHL